VAFYPSNGNCEPGEEAELNKQFQALKHEAWQRAQGARHNLR
jgi:hypothetical protein